MLSRELGALLLILGTSIGGGMLALPAVTAHLNYLSVMLYLVLAWGLMTLGALALVMVQLQDKAEAGVITLARKTLGPVISTLTLITSFFLLYSLLCAYTAATGDVFHAILNRLHLFLPQRLTLFLAALLLGSVVYRGIAAADYLNRIFMFMKIIACFLLIASLIPSTEFQHLALGQHQYSLNGFLIMITSFGYGLILPSIGRYLNFDKKRLLRIVFLGGLIPLVLYLIWIAVVHAVLTHEQLSLLASSGNTTSILLQQLESITGKPILQSFAWIFGSICTFTAFLGVSISLLDLLTDALKIKKTRRPPLFVMLLTYLPPTAITLFAPHLFVQALTYAGICCALLLVVLPIGMWLNRMRQSKA